MIGLAALLAGLRLRLGERPMDYTGPQALLDAGFALGLAGLILLLAGGVGAKAQRWLGLHDLTRLEQAVFRLPIGLGIVAYGVLGLGLVGLLQPWAILLWLMIVAAWSWRDWSNSIGSLAGWLTQWPRAWTTLGVVNKLLLSVGMLILALTTLQALIPPWDYDGLMYHLQGPRLFLQIGRIVVLPDVWQANGAITPDMLYLLGLAFRSDTFAKLMHLTFAVLLVLGTFAFGQRYLKPAGGWIAAGILIGIPIFPIWASWAYADMSWAVYQFLGLYAIVLWADSNQRRWLSLAGLLTGWALGSKYLALGSAAIFGLWVLWRSRSQGWRAGLAHGLIFGIVALLVGSPWYIKNWMWTGNPVYPFIFGGPDWGPERLDLLMTYLHSFGTGHSLGDYLLLPWNLYARRAHYVTFMGSTEVPSLLFPLAGLYLRIRNLRGIDDVAGVTMLLIALWGLGSQQTRFLLPLFPGLSLLTAAVLIHLAARFSWRKCGWILVTSLVAGTVVATLVFSIIYFFHVRPLQVVLGSESKDVFLRRMVDSYPALQFVQAHLSPQARVMLMWDAQGYYCDEHCLADTEPSRWTHLTLRTPRTSSIIASLEAMGVTHLLFNIKGADFFLRHDPTHQHHRAVELFLNEFRASCTREVYRDQWVSLFELTCR